jgi:positive regulator of sigma E activity
MKKKSSGETIVHYGVVQEAGNYSVTRGDNVTVMMQQSMGFKAILLSYIIPFFVAVATLVTLVSLSVSELISGLI